VKVKNARFVTGKEAVQVYVYDKISSVTTLVKELKGFGKTEVNSNEIAKLSFFIPFK
jgi:hypothetical protein